MVHVLWRRFLGNWLLAVLLTTQVASGLVWLQSTVEARPLGAIREYEVTLKAPDLMVPNVFTATVGDTIRFRVTQAGPAPHNLHIGGNGVDVESPMWSANTTAVWEWMPPRAGIYAIYCDVGSRDFPGLEHRHFGPMEGVILVTEPGVAAPDLTRWQMRNVRLDAVGGSGVTGQAYLQPRADGAIGVRVSAAGLRPDVAYVASVYDRRGAACTDGMVASAPLRPSVIGGAPAFLLTVNMAVEDWGGVAIREASATAPLACGNASTASVGVDVPLPAASPAALPRTGDALLALVFVGNAAGLLLLAAGARLRRAGG